MVSLAIFGRQEGARSAEGEGWPLRAADHLPDLSATPLPCVVGSAGDRDRVRRTPPLTGDQRLAGSLRSHSAISSMTESRRRRSSILAAHLIARVERVSMSDRGCSVPFQGAPNSAVRAGRSSRRRFPGQTVSSAGSALRPTFGLALDGWAGTSGSTASACSRWFCAARRSRSAAACS